MLDAVARLTPRRDAGRTIPGMDSRTTDLVAARIDRLLRMETVVWLSSVASDGRPHLVPVWFSWDGDAVLIASKPNARKVGNLRANPSVMLALGEPALTCTIPLDRRLVGAIRRVAAGFARGAGAPALA